MGMGRLQTSLPSRPGQQPLCGALEKRGEKQAVPPTLIRTNGRMGHSIGSDRTQPSQLVGARWMGRMPGLDWSLGRSVGDRGEGSGGFLGAPFPSAAVRSRWERTEHCEVRRLGRGVRSTGSASPVCPSHLVTQDNPAVPGTRAERIHVEIDRRRRARRVITPWSSLALHAAVGSRRTKSVLCCLQSGISGLGIWNVTDRALRCPQSTACRQPGVGSAGARIRSCLRRALSAGGACLWGLARPGSGPVCHHPSIAILFVLLNLFSSHRPSPLNPGDLTEKGSGKRGSVLTCVKIMQPGCCL